MLKIICLAVALAAVAKPDTATTKKKAVAKHHASAVAGKSKKKAPSGKASARKATAGKASSGKVASANARTKGKKGRHVARSNQQVPTPERYKEIQDSLASKGYFKGDPNGKWGSDSDEALKRFQADQNLTPDGKIGSLSLIALGLGPKRLTAQTNPKPAAETEK